MRAAPTGKRSGPHSSRLSLIRPSSAGPPSPPRGEGNENSKASIMTLALAIHGGCGTLPKTEMTEAEWAEARSDLAKALRAGWTILSAGGPAVDAVEAAVREMEDSAHF